MASKSRQGRVKGKIRERQNRNFSLSPEHHLIVSEGIKTEPNYFKALAKNINDNRSFPAREKVDFIRFHIEGVGKNTRDVFDDAVEMAQEIEKRESVRIRKVWVVYDKDDFPHDRFNVVEELCKKQSSDETQYFALWSNQCIELWFLLHFEYCNTALHRSDYERKLDNYLKSCGYSEKYEKNSEKMFEWLLPYIDEAMRNSKRLFATYSEEATSAKNDPATVVFQLFDILLPYIKR